jgi:hypothetical protein
LALNPLANVLHADSASGGKTVSTATGRLDENAECLFVLDHQTGILSCSIINPRNAMTGGVYIANVATQMKLDKLGDLDFVMVTGYNAFGLGGRTGNLRPASCVCYVVEGSTARLPTASPMIARFWLKETSNKALWKSSGERAFRPENLKRN